MIKFLALAWAALVALAPAPVFAGQADDDARSLVSGLRHVATDQGVLRLILDVDPVPAFTIFTLAGPDRLVVDFPIVRWRLPGDLLSGSAQIKAVRYGRFRHDRSRLIFDIAAPLQVARAFTQPPVGPEPGRLIIDLTPTSRAAFEATAGAPEAARWRDRPQVGPAGRSDAVIVAIDPGHGGMDPGASAGGLIEKTIVLSFAKRLAAEIRARDGLTPFLVRESDEFVPLAERIARARAARAHVLISLHADSVKAGIADGMSVYTLSARGTDEAADLFAARENRGDVLGGADLFGDSDALTRLLVQLAQRGTEVEAQKLARSLVAALDRSVPMLKSRPLRRGNFRILKTPDLPSVLIELGFLDNLADQHRLADPEWQSRAATGLVDGLVAWKELASPGFVAPR